MASAHVLLIIVAVAVLGGSARRQVPTPYRDWQGMSVVDMERRLRSALSPLLRSAIDDKVLEFLEKLRENMDKPNEQLGLPALDPLWVQHADLDVHDQGIRVNGSLDKVNATGLSGFVVNRIKLNILLLSFDFDFTLPQLQARGEYKVDGELAVLPIFGEGPFSLTVTNFSVNGTVKMGVNNTFVYVKTFKVNLHVQAIETHLEGLLGGGDLGEVANKVISDMVPELLEENQEAISSRVSSLLQDMVNQRLDGVTLQDILDLINGKG